MKQGLLLILFLALFGKVYADSFFHSDSAYLEGRINGFSGKTGMIHIVNGVTGIDRTCLVELDSGGFFNVRLSLPYPMRNFIKLNDKGIPFYLTPGDTLKLTVEWSEATNTYQNITYSGSLGRINNELFEAEKIKLNQIPFPENDLTASSRIAFHDKVRKTCHDYLMELSRRKKDLLPATWKLLSDEVVLHQATVLLYFDQLVAMDGEPEAFTEPSQDRYYDFMREIDLNDPTLLSLLSADEFFSLMEYCPLLTKKWKLQQSPDLFIQTLKKAGCSVTPEVEVMASADWRKLEMQYSDSLLYGLAQQIVYREKILTQEMHLKPGIIWDILNIRMLKTTLTYHTSDRTTALKKYNLLMTGIAHPQLVKQGSQLMEDFFPQTPSVPKALVLPEGPAKDILNRLIQPYHGKLILMDIWATWCSPCLDGIKQMQPIREKLAGKNIAFLFVSSEKNSPVELYNRIMQSVEGDKYCLNEDEYNYLCQALQVTSIPHYVLINQTGQIINPDLQILEPEKTGKLLEDLLE